MLLFLYGADDRLVCWCCSCVNSARGWSARGGLRGSCAKQAVDFLCCCSSAGVHSCCPLLSLTCREGNVQFLPENSNVRADLRSAPFCFCKKNSSLMNSETFTFFYVALKSTQQSKIHYVKKIKYTKSIFYTHIKMLYIYIYIYTHTRASSKCH